MHQDILGALHHGATKISWNNDSKIRFAVLITDAPTHGQEYNDDPSDQFPNGAPNSPSIRDLVNLYC